MLKLHSEQNALKTGSQVVRHSISCENVEPSLCSPLLAQCSIRTATKYAATFKRFLLNLERQVMVTFRAEALRYAAT